MFDSEESDVESLHHLTINEHYAKAFEYKKEREELQKLKDKYGSDFEDDEETFPTDSESDESEDDDGEELTATVDAAILRTLARIERKDPGIYDTKRNIFGEEEKKVAPIRTSRLPKDRYKPVTMRQAVLESALNPDSRSPSPEPLPHVEEQRALRDETIAAFRHAFEDDNEEDFLVPREKSKGEQEQEEEEYKAFLEREVGEDLQTLVTINTNEEPGKTMMDDEIAKGVDNKPQRKRKKVGDVKVATEDSHKKKWESDQEFLTNYILNRGWIDRSANHVPTYHQVVSSGSKGTAKTKQDMDVAGSDSDLADDKVPQADSELDDDDFEEIVDRFESSYNFRFEEPDAAVIKSYPRNLPSLVRREDTSRKEARERRRQRKEEEMLKKKEDVKLLKKLKMKEIRAKLERIGREGGIPLESNPALQEIDLDGEWDSNVHDRQMAALYDNDDDVDDEKPHWDEDIEIGDITTLHDGASQTNMKKKKKKKKKERSGEEGVGVDIDVMDADVDRDVDDDKWDGTEEMRKRKLDEYMDEIYGLDFNDMVGDLPTRFKYVPVPPQNFALTPVEILMATDQELNEYMSVKKYAPYRKEARWDSKRTERLKEFRNKIGERVSIAGGGDENDMTGGPAKRRKGKKERMKLKAGMADEDHKGDAAALDAASALPSGPDRLKRKRENEVGERVHEGWPGRKRKHRNESGPSASHPLG